MDANCKNCSKQAIYIGNDDDDFNEGDIVIKICIINTRTNKQTRYGLKSENFWDIWLAEYLRYSFEEKNNKNYRWPLAINRDYYLSIPAFGKKPTVHKCLRVVSSELRSQILEYPNSHLSANSMSNRFRAACEAVKKDDIESCLLIQFFKV
jgi:hypothetical protein